jgi:hypothetical protein
MREILPQEFAKRLFDHHHCAKINPRYLQWRSINAPDGQPLAVLGYRSAGDGPLFLESYLDRPVEAIVAERLGISVARHEIVEIGCLAAIPSAALVRLWRETAGLLGAHHAVAVATLTEPLRRSFARVGLPLVPIVAASSERVAASEEDWGSYYHQAPWVCAGVIADGATALSRYASRPESEG